MVAPQRYPQEPQPKQGGGCLRGCLIVSLVLLVVLVGGGAVTFFAGRAYISRQLPAWEERYPALAIASDLLQLRAELAAPEAQPEVPSGGSAGRLPGTDDRALVPDDIPLLAHPQLESYSISEAHVTGYQRLWEPYEGVLEHVHESMPQHGWELVAEQPAQDGQLLLWHKGERSCQIEVVVYEGAAELWLRCSGG